MRKRKVYIAIFIIIALAFLAGNFDYPKFAKNLQFSIFNFQFLDVSFKLGLDLQGGTHLIYGTDLTNIAKEDYDSSMQGLRDVIERRINIFGVREPVVQVEGQRLIVELAGIKDPNQAIEMIGQTPYLEFKEQKENYQEIIEKNQKAEEAGTGQMEDPFAPALLTGKYLKKAELGFDQTTSYKALVSIQFNDEGSKIFEELTKKNIGKPLAIFIDGVPISIPTVQEAISGGNAQISGDFTIEEARALARNLNAGALPVPINLISQQSVGPTLGKISLEDSLKAGIFGLLAVVIFMIVFYRLSGFLASLSLLIYIIFILALFKLIPVTLTLAGIGGLILSVGMAVDANVLIFARMGEELKLGRNFSAAVEEGFRRAWPAIRDGNLTTLIVAGMLFSFGTSFVKGFALTLSIGIIISMFSAIFITKNFLRVFVGTKLEKVKILWQ